MISALDIIDQICLLNLIGYMKNVEEINFRRPELVAVWKIGSIFKNYFCICNIHAFPKIFMWKNIHRRDCSKEGTIPKYVANIVFMKYIGKNATFLQRISNLTIAWNFEKIDIWYLYGYCLYLSREKMGRGVTVEFLKRGYFNL